MEDPSGPLPPSPAPLSSGAGGGLSTPSTPQSGTFPFPPKCAMISGRPALPKAAFICQRKEVLRLVTRPYPQRGRSGKGSRPPAAVPAGPAPSILAQLINLLYNLVDRMYIGHIPDVGATALTGVGGHHAADPVHLRLCRPGEYGRRPPGLHPPGGKGKGPGRAGPGQLHHHAGDHCPGPHGGGPGLWSGPPFLFFWGQPGHPSLCLGLH